MDSLQNNQIARKIDVTDKKAEYDENVKWLLSEKIILAHILVYAARELPIGLSGQLLLKK